MGYTTDFEGAFNVTPPLKPEHAAYLRKFSDTRRITRDAELCKDLPDPLRKAVGLPVGKDGRYFVGGVGFAGQGHDKSVVDHNTPPFGQPGLWCQWTVTDDGSQIVWDGGEKFYDYIEWIEYLVDHFLEPWGYKISGDVEWQGEKPGDFGRISYTENKRRVFNGVREFREAR